MAKKRAVLITDEDPSREPRILNILYLLDDHFEWHFLCTQNRNQEDTTRIVLKHDVIFHRNFPTVFRKLVSLFLRIWQFAIAKSGYLDFLFRKRMVKGRNATLVLPDADLVIFTHPWMFSIAEMYKGKECDIVCDLYEYYPDQFPSPFQSDHNKEVVCWQLRDVKKSDSRFICASPLSAQRYIEEFGIESTYFPCTMPFYATEFIESDEGTPLSAVYQGTANPSREIENLIHLFGRRTDMSLSLFLVFPTHISEYKEKIISVCNSYNNVNLLDPVEKHDLIERMSEFDFGVFPLPATSVNQEILVPNKVFDFIQARIPCVVTPNPGLALVVSEYDSGVIADDYSMDAFERAIDRFVTRGKADFRGALEKAARETCLETYRQTLLQVVDGRSPESAPS